MKKLLRAALLTVAGLSLFTVSLAGFAWMRTDNPHELPLVGALFDEPAGLHAADETASVRPQESRSATRANRAGLGLLDVFRLDSPLDGAELSTLASQLKTRLAALDARDRELRRAEEGLAERARFLDEQLATVNGLRTELERWQTELEQRQAEVRRDESAQAERDAESWVKLAKVFEKGEAAGLARKLEGYSPEDAARILSSLKPDRARELLEGLGGPSWKDYWEAYRRALGQASES